MKNQRIEIDEFKNFTFLNFLKKSEDGKKTAVVANKVNKENGYNKVLLYSRGYGFDRLTSETGSIGTYIWLDNIKILFEETRCEKVKLKKEKGYDITSFHEISIHGGEAKHKFDIPLAVSNISKIEYDKFIVLANFDNNKPSIEGKETHEAEEILKKYKEETEAHTVIDEVPFWFNGKGITNKKRQRLYIWDSSKSSTIPLTGPLDDVSKYKISPCKKFILWTGSKAPYEVKELKSNLYLIDIEKKTETPLLKENMFIKDFDFYGDKYFLVANNGEKYSFAHHGNFYTLENSELTLIKEYDLSLESSAISDSSFSGGENSKLIGDLYYFNSLNGIYSEIYTLNLKSGEIINITNFKANVNCFDVEGNVSFIAMKDLSLSEVYELKSSEGAYEVEKMSDFNKYVLNDKTLSTPEYHKLVDSEGIEFEGFVLKPIGYESGKKYPAILNIHGGPKAAYGDGYFHEMQYWANEGYFVLFSNPRGSDGKGNEFAHISGKYGTIDYENLMQFVDEMLEKYKDIDKERLGVTGGSYGGFMTNWIVGHTDRFKAAVTQRSISNWISKTGTTDIGYFFNIEQQQSDPWNSHDKMWWHSPLKYAPNVKTPTLILHSDQDLRCWTAEAYQWFTALKLHGVSTRLVMFKGENHELSRSGKPNNRIKRLEEIINWMNKYLKPEGNL